MKTIIIPHYIYYYILELILNYKYIHVINFFYLKDYSHMRNNEIISYSLVSHKWYEIVSNLLSFKILTFNNIELLLNFISKSSIGKDKFKLIKSNNCINFKSLDLYKEYSKKKQKEVFLNEKILIDINDQDIDDFKEIMEFRFPENCEFNLNISIDQYYGDIINFIEKIKNEGNNNFSLKLSGTDMEDSVINNNKLVSINNKNTNNLYSLNKINKINAKRINYEPNDEYCTSSYFHMNYSSLFENPNLEELFISCTDHVDPISISKINNNNTKLKTLSISMLFHDIIKGLNSNLEKNGFIQNECDNDYGGLYVENSIKKDWELMIENLSKNSTIKELNLKNFCYKINCCESHIYDFSKLTKGFKTIFSSPITNIETLELQTIDFLDTEFIEGLSNNKSIKNLILINTNHSLIFGKVLTKNHTIRNIYINFINSIDDLIKILNENQNLDLYSITIKLKLLNNDDINKFKNEYKPNLNNQIIKEFNFYCFNSNKKWKTLIY